MEANRVNVGSRIEVDRAHLASIYTAASRLTASSCAAVLKRTALTSFGARWHVLDALACPGSRLHALARAGMRCLARAGWQCCALLRAAARCRALARAGTLWRTLALSGIRWRALPRVCTDLPQLRALPCDAMFAQAVADGVVLCVCCVSGLCFSSQRGCNYKLYDAAPLG
jgi:hypothetical protein